MDYQYWLLLCTLCASMLLSVWAGKLDPPAAIIGGLTGFLIFLGAGFTGVALVGTFFILGTAATSWKHHIKEKAGLSELNKGRRTMGQVLANAGVASLLGCCTLLNPGQSEVFYLMMAASLSAATADTLSSELGNVYGRRFINILTFKKDKRGLNGVISLEGTFSGVAGSVIIGVVYAFGFGWNHFLIIVISGTAGNIADSILGASLERKGLLGNNAVNFLNTAVGALVALGLNCI